MNIEDQIKGAFPAKNGMESGMAGNFTISVKNSAADNGTVSFRLIPSFNRSSSNGNLIESESFEEKTLVVDSSPSDLYTIYEQIKHGQFKVTGIRVSASSAAAIKGGRILVRRGISMLNPEGTQRTIYFNNAMSLDSERDDTVDLNASQLASIGDLCASTELEVQNVAQDVELDFTFYVVAV